MIKLNKKDEKIIENCCLKKYQTVIPKSAPNMFV